VAGKEKISRLMRVVVMARIQQRGFEKATGKCREK
jgi:hypothetical protein